MSLGNKLNLIYLSEFFIFFHLFGGVLIPFFTIWGGLSLSELMMVQAWFSLCVLLFEIPTGTLADTFGRKNTVILSFFTNIIGVILYVVYPTFWMFMLAEMFWALSVALASGAKEAMVYDTLVDHGEEKQSQKVFGTFKMSHLWALMISAPLGSMIGQAWGFEWPVLLMIVPFTFSAICLFFVPEPKSHQLPEGQTREPFKKQIISGWQYFKSHPYLMVMTFDMVWIWSLAFMVIWFQQVVLLDLGVNESTFGWFVTFGLISQMVALKSFPFLEKILKSKKNVLTLSGILPAIGFALLAFYPSIITVLLALAFCTGFGLSRRSLYSSYVNKFIDSHHRATVNSYINIGINISGFLIKPVLGFMADYSMFATFLCLALGCFFVTIFSRVKEEMLLD